jgi:GDP-L-fucose synthase
MDSSSKIFVAGASGMVGSSVVRVLIENGYTNILTPTRKDLDLLSQKDTYSYLSDNCPDYVIVCAAKVGGIQSNNTYRAQFIHENLAIALNLIHGSHLADVDNLCFLGSSCIYPKFSNQPIKEEYLLSGALEPTNEPYAIAKIAGLKLCESYKNNYGRNYFSVMPTNLFGPNDNYNLETSHVLPALLRKFHNAKVNKENAVEVWGTGAPRREFLYVDDLANAILFLCRNKTNYDYLNIGYGSDISIEELALLIMDVIDYSCELSFNSSKPDGTPRKLLDSGKMKELGWQPQHNFQDALRLTYQDFLSNLE